MRNLILAILILCACVIAFRYAPFHMPVSDPHIEKLINQLASSNSPPVFPGEPPHFHLNQFLKKPGQWKPEAQQPVSAAYYELKSLGKTAFPYLIKYLNDDRYSHERSYSTFLSCSVGDACQSLIDEQVDVGGVSYKSRESANGISMGYEVVFETYITSNYGSYAAWWRNNRNRSLTEMRVDCCNWRIRKEKEIGFADDEQRDWMMRSLDRALAEAKALPDEMPLPVPDWYTIDAIVLDIKMSRQFEDEK